MLMINFAQIKKNYCTANAVSAAPHRLIAAAQLINKSALIQSLQLWVTMMCMGVELALERASRGEYKCD